jgi:hypothetical protein
METKMVLFAMYLFWGCNVQNNQSNLDRNFQAKDDTINSESFYNFAFISPDKYIIEWGTSSFKSVSKDTFEILGSGSLEICEANSKYIVLNQPCGTSCALYVLLPLMPNKNELTFWNVVYNNLDNEIIITTIDPGVGKFAISNYGNNTQHEIILDDLCPAADKSMCIDSIFINKDEIYIQYQGSKWEADKKDNKFKIVRLF